MPRKIKFVYLKITLLFVAVYILKGCVVIPTVYSDVQVFHSLSENIQPATYDFHDLDFQLNSLEHQTYKKMIAKKLSEYGHKQATANENPDAIIIFTYTIDSGKEKTYSYSNYELNVFTGNFDKVSSVDTQTQYNRFLKIWITNNPIDRNLKKQTIYEAEVKSKGSSATLARVMPSMINALFKKFPGPTIQTRREINLLNKLN